MSNLFSPILPYNTGFLKVSNLHTIYYEECGRRDGIPIVFLHGGPGGGIIPEYRQFFDPQKWRIILFDQRGCGQSTPFAELKENTTWDLVADIEKLRNFLKISSWCVFGGSWGSTLALAYAQSHPSSCRALFLRGIFMLTAKELRWFYQEGASFIYPDAWEHYIKPIAEEQRDELISAYYKKLTSRDTKTRQEAAKAWSIWEASTSKLIQNKSLIEDFSNDKFAEAFALIECHYFINKGFFPKEDYLLDNIDTIRHIPTTIVHGRYDVVCPLKSAWSLHKSWPEAKFEIISDAGHSLSESGITKSLLKALAEY
jgi:proline iminopeptidase